MNINSLDVTIMLAYLLLLVIVGVIGSRKAKTAEDYVLAGRNLGFFMYFACLGAVILGGASTIGSTQLGYEFGISGMWLVAMLGFGIMLLGIFLAKRISKLSVMTISEYLSKRFGVEVGLVSALIAATYAMMVSVTQVIGMGTILNVLLGWDLSVSMLVGGGIVLLYTILGGMWSVTMTDIVQFVIMTIGIFFILLPMGLSKAGGWSALQTNLPDTYFSFSGIGGQQIFQYFLLFALGMVVAQDIWQRILTAKSIKIARSGTVAAGIYSLLYGIAVAIIGMCAFVILPGLEDNQNTFASMAVATLPSGLLGLVVAAVVSALMSTASGTLLASSTLVSNDIIKRYFKKDVTDKQYLKLSRMVTTVIGILTIVCAMWIQNVLVALDVAYAVLSGGIFAPVVLGLFWKKATAKAAFYSIIISTIVILAGLAIQGITSTTPIVYGIAVSFVMMIVLSLATQQKEELATNKAS